MIEGAGGAPAVFNTPSNQAKHNVFDVSYPIVDQYDPLTTWIESLPAGSGQRPLPIPSSTTRSPSRRSSVRSGSWRGRRQDGVLQVLPAELPRHVRRRPGGRDRRPGRFLGTVDVPTVAAFMKAFQQQRYNPKILAATGPDQGAAFLKAVGKATPRAS